MRRKVPWSTVHRSSFRYLLWPYLVACLIRTTQTARSFLRPASDVDEAAPRRHSLEISLSIDYQMYARTTRIVDGNYFCDFGFGRGLGSGDHGSQRSRRGYFRGTIEKHRVTALCPRNIWSSGRSPGLWRQVVVSVVRRLPGTVLVRPAGGRVVEASRGTPRRRQNTAFSLLY